MRTLDFDDHRRELDNNRYVYAVVSRRARGLSIGVNLNPDKVCNFDCPYCQVDRTVPGGSRDVDLGVLEQELRHVLELVRSGELWSVSPFDTAEPAMRRVHDIAMAGDGEPTACPQFDGAVALIARLHQEYGLTGVHQHLLTNATLLHRPRTREALERFHQAGGVIWGKLDAGTQAWFERVDGTSLPLERVQQNLEYAARHWRLILQCLFHGWNGDEGPDEAEIQAWADRVRRIADAGSIRQVQVYTTRRVPSDDSVTPLSLEQLQHIARRLDGLGLDVAVYA